ncbi:MAG: PASTA domain-containing protein [Desulfovibrio sp.]|jgi:cell division protein FtsI (penicillin-binding protein 3)|nr:PASTA domain-containing protein [Desulfovibrio sp.]
MFVFPLGRKGRGNFAKPRNSRTPLQAQPGAVSRSAGNRDWGRVRINLVVGFLCVLWIALWGRAWYLQMLEGPRLAEKARRQHMLSELVSGRRGMIYDRNGQALASSVEAKSVCAWPRKIQDFEHAANVLGPILGEEPQEIYRKLSTARGHFIYLKRKIDDSGAEAVRKAGIAGIGLLREYDRVYPSKHLAGQLLGFVGQDDRGLEGLERSMDARLGCIPTRLIVQKDAKGRRFYLREEGIPEPRGEDITLTLDARMQFFAEEAMEQVVKESGARWGGALVVDVSSGDIMAWAQVPLFNPNNFRESSPLIYRNRLASDALEPGSTFKPFVMAAALQENKVTPTTPIDCEGGKWVSKNFTIRDTASYGVLPASKVLRYSSNIGMAKIGLSLGASTFYKYLHSLGFGQRTGLPVAESGGKLRIPRDWSEIDIMSTSFGQSISVTGLQMAQAYLTLLNDGVFKPLRLVKTDALVEERRKRVFSAAATREVSRMMKDVVQEKDGTGKRARLDGVSTAGKTGTAQKADHKAGGYGTKRLASFVGFFPAESPNYLILIMIDEPLNNQFGGVVAAPVFREIATRILTYAGLTQPGLRDGKPEGYAADTASRRLRKLRLADADIPAFMENMRPAVKKQEMRLPYHLAKAAESIPDVKGKSVRNAVELFARGGIVPEIRGDGTRVVRQSPPAGSAWPEDGKTAEYILWLSEK